MIQSSIQNISERLFVGQMLKIFAPPPDVDTRGWAEENRWLTSDVSSIQGKMDCSRTPWMIRVMEVLDDPTIPIIIGRKSAQIAWTETINNWIGRTIDVEPRNILIAFARAKSYQAYFKEKLKPYIENTPALYKKIGSLKKISHTHIPFSGGFIKLVTTGTIGDLKSSVIPIIIVEEPDDVKEDINKQGDGIEILKQRMKTFSDSKLIFGGTPTDYGLSQVEMAFSMSNKMFYMVPCHKCGDFHTLDFKNLKADTFQDRKIDEQYGIYNPETAYYECPHCAEIWTFEQKNKNVKEALNFFEKGWQITRPQIKDIYGFSFNELLSPFPRSSFIELSKTWYKAKVKYEQGREGPLKSFINNSMGLGYQPPQIGIDIDELKKKRLNYPENVIPYEGLILTCGIDVQRNRFAIVVRAWGKHNNSWLVHWSEIFGNVIDGEDPIWDKLTEFVSQPWQHGSGDGRVLYIEAGSIDCADGETTELVYRWVLEMEKLGHDHIFACRGMGIEKNTDYEIFNEPNRMEVSNDTQVRKTLAERMGVNVFLMGTHRAHAEIIRRLNLNGRRDRYYHCETSYGNYEEGILSCVKHPDGSFRKKPNAAKEAIDCEKLALHAAYAIQIRNFQEEHWKAREDYLYANVER